MGCGASTEDIAGSNTATAREKEGAQYIDVQTLGGLLRGPKPPIRLLKASGLLHKASCRLGMRQDLEANEPSIFGGEETVQRCIEEVWKTATQKDMHCMYPPIVALSYCWKTREHPDPNGERLGKLQGPFLVYGQPCSKRSGP
jgi:hypothetical protein